MRVFPTKPYDYLYLVTRPGGEDKYFIGWVREKTFFGRTYYRVIAEGDSPEDVWRRIQEYDCGY